MEYEGQGTGTKGALRLGLRALRDSMSSELRTAFSQRISGHLLNLSPLQSARRVALYSAVQSEVDLRTTAKALGERGVACFFPRVRRQTLQFASWDHGQKAGVFGVKEPIGPAISLDSIECVICPGLGFDRQGNRLGYGRGYYDRALQGYRGVAVGVTFSCCLQEAIPHDSHDQPVEYVVTEEGCIPTAALLTPAEPVHD